MIEGIFSDPGSLTEDIQHSVKHGFKKICLSQDKCTFGKVTAGECLFDRKTNQLS